MFTRGQLRQGYLHHPRTVITTIELETTGYIRLERPAIVNKHYDTMPQLPGDINTVFIFNCRGKREAACDQRYPGRYLPLMDPGDVLLLNPAADAAPETF